MKRKEELKQALANFQRLIFNKTPNGRSIYFITICLPYKFSVPDIMTFTQIMKRLLYIFEKHLLKHNRRWMDHLYDFDAFFENQNYNGQWHLHLLGTFIDHAGIQLSKDYLDKALSKTSNTILRFYKANQKLDYDIKLVPYSDLKRVVGYCTKEMTVSGFLNTNRYTCAQVLFGFHKTHRKRKNLTKTQRRIRRIKNKEDMSAILYSKYHD